MAKLQDARYWGTHKNIQEHARKMLGGRNKKEETGVLYKERTI